MIIKNGLSKITAFLFIVKLGNTSFKKIFIMYLQFGGILKPIASFTKLNKALCV